jgi:hypothetical protein
MAHMTGVADIAPLVRTQGVTAPAGFRAAGIAAGIKASGAMRVPDPAVSRTPTPPPKGWPQHCRSGAPRLGRLKSRCVPPA